MSISDYFAYFLTKWDTFNLQTTHGYNFFLNSGFGPDPETQKMKVNTKPRN
jgi:hypothetical protein